MLVCVLSFIILGSVELWLPFYVIIEREFGPKVLGAIFHKRDGLHKRAPKVLVVLLSPNGFK